MQRPKDAPGPGPTPVALLRALDLTIGRRIHGLVPGEFRAHDLGGGLELAQVRPYQPGDDVRRIDWNVTARTTVPHVRVHVPERALTTWLVLDTSPSMTFGTAQRRKADVAEGVAIAVGHLATQRGNRLGIVTFGGATDRRVPPTVGRDGLLATLLVAQEAPATIDAPGTAVATASTALRFVAATARRGGLVVVVSDFRGPRDWLKPLAGVAAKHQVVAVQIDDPARGRPARRRRADARRCGDRPRDPCRHVVGRAARPLRRGRSRRAPRRSRSSSVVAASGMSCCRPRPAGCTTSPVSCGPSGGRHDVRRAAPAPLLLAVPLVVIGYLLVQRRRSRYVVRFTNVDLLANLVPRTPAWRRHVPPALYVLAMSALVIGLARPTAMMAVPREDATIVLAMDVSGSMLATDVAPNRLASAREAASTFIDQLPPTFQVGLVTFSTTAQVVVTPTTDRARIAEALDRLTADGGTALGDAIARSTELAQAVIDPDAASAAGATPAPSSDPDDPLALPSAAPSAAPSADPSAAPESGEPPLVATVLLSDGANSTGEAGARRSGPPGRRRRGPGLHDRARHRRPAS